MESLGDSSFQFDGRNSDLAQQYYHRHIAGDKRPQLALGHEDLSSSVQTRLNEMGLRFERLHGLLQRALLWDSGYVFGSNRELIRVYTRQGVPMSSIAVSETAYRNVGCSTTNCTLGNGTMQYRSHYCTGEQMLRVVQCASEEVRNRDIHGAMWANGGTLDIVPEMNMLRHAWTDAWSGVSYLVYAIHTVADSSEPAWGHCSSQNKPASMIIPCDAYSPESAMEKQWQEPAPGRLVDAWLKQVPVEKKGFNFLILLPALLGLMLLIGIAAYWMRRKRRQQAGIDKGHDQTIDPDALLSVVSKASILRSPAVESASTDDTSVEDSFEACASNSVWRMLLSDPHLSGKRIPIERLRMESLLCRGAFGEVWAASYMNELYAVKRLLQKKSQSYEEVEDFAAEIQLTASLNHENIVRFVGVAWSNLENLCMVTELLPRGDLQRLLKTSGDLLSWLKEKQPIALGIARALAYLHDRSPVIIHRDVKAKNVLMTEDLQGKLIDFGVSRARQESSMTVGVGTPYWTAPEILDGSRYTEKSDIYSFGVLLCELDTCKSPYADLTCPEEKEKQMRPFQILKLVIAGTLRPQVSSDCPPRIGRLVEACLQHDPDARPNTKQLIAMLEGETLVVVK